MRAGDGAPRGPTPGPLQRNVFVRPRSGEPAPSGPPLGPMMRPVQPPVRAGDRAPREPTLEPLRHSGTACSSAPRGSRAQWATCGEGHLGLTHTETQRGRLWTTCGRRCVGSENSQTTPTTTSTNPNTPTTVRCCRIKRHPPQPAQPQRTNHWAPRTRKRHQQQHRPQWPTESSDLTQPAKGRTG